MKKIILIFIIIMSFICGYCISAPSPNPKINVFGTYVLDFSTISINHDLTYQFTSPFSSGKIIKLDEQTCKLENGDLNDFIIIFFKDTLKLIDPKNNIIKEFNKNTSSESQLEES